MAGKDPRIGPHRVVRRLGVGGMAETFVAMRALSEQVEQPVCIKRILPAYADDAAYCAMFRREAALATRLRHPNIVALLDVGEDDDQPFLVLELVDGIDLRALLTTAPNRTLDPDVVAFVGLELAHALAYAHAPSPGRPAVVHRDLSPSNVLLSRGGDVKLADFGLARPLAGSDATQSGTVRGKIPYIAPEQMRGATVDGRADLFALGVTLFECLAGQRPFDGSHEVETMTRILGNLRPPLASLAPDVPAPLAELVERLLAPSSDERPADAHEVIAALDALAPPILARTKLLDLVESRLGGAESRLHVGTTAVRPVRVEVDVAVEPSSGTLELAAPDARAETPRTALARPRPSDVAREAESGAPESAPSGRAVREASSRLGRNATRIAVGLAIAIGLGFAGREIGRATTSSIAEAGRGEAGEAGADGGAEAVAVTAGGAVAVAVAVADAGAEAVPQAETEAETETEAEAVPQAVAVAVPQAEAVPAASRPPRAVPSSGLAHLRVFVSPWGDVWIDGRPIGRAPASIELPAGRHRVSGGQDSPRVSRTVQLRPGQHRSVAIDLSQAE